MGLSGRVWIGALFGILLSATATEAAPGRSAGATAQTPVAKIRIRKTAHQMELLAKDDTVVATFKVAIGPGGFGNKHREGDMVTPVGRYHVISRNPSQFKVFMRLDYPNKEDRARFARLKAEGALSKSATIGGDIGIHGGSPPGYNTGAPEHDWTLGCISVEDDEITRISPMVKDGTVVEIAD